MIVVFNETASKGGLHVDFDLSASTVFSSNGYLDDMDKELAHALLDDYLAAQPLEE